MLENFNVVGLKVRTDMTRVMIIEDDPLLSIVEEKLVIKLGYEVVGKAKSGEEALQKVKEYNPSILLMDIQLSGELSGIETARELRMQKFDAPVIFLSGDDSSFIVNQAKDIEFIDFLLKPVSKDDLSISLQKAEHRLDSENQFAA
ncbi:MAG: response regulator [Balneola sp.]|jgi:YesN/AraC family two-component response regulator|nr:response regulator [Balneola sp.]MBE77945.1 response regulator [Balneola sp.]|tara:strand:+ start:822 stop:1259 length:438 start_codon:yes stop_codon:yes gene_type:complete